MYKIIIYIVFFIISSSQVLAQQQLVCGTPEATIEDLVSSNQEFEAWKQNRSRETYPIMILVAWHVIYSSNNEGYLSQSHIENSIASMNLEYNQNQIYFVLDTITYHQNDDWFYNIEDTGDQVEAEMRSQTFIDPYHYYNIWTVNLNGTGAGGWNQFGSWNAEGSYWQGATVHYSQSGGGMVNHTIIHEAGHHLELSHTFQYGCNAPGDVVDDTPYQADNDTYSCSPSTDTCPNDPGTDPVRNHMNYSSCRDEFSPGQIDRIFWSIETYHPGYLENNFNYPVLSVNGLSFLQDTDGDNQFNPGDTSRVKIVLANEWGGDAVNVALNLNCEDPRVSVLDNYIEFNGSPIGDIIISPGEISSTVFDWFLIAADAGATPGNVECTITITAGTDDFPYEQVEDLDINLTLSQFGFPLENLIIKSSPIVSDLDGDGSKEIYFGSDNNALHGYNSFAEMMDGFPFETTESIRSSPAIADIDNDGEKEIVFGNNAGKLFIVSSEGVQKLAYNILGFIEGSPSLVDIDGDQDLEIVFNSATTSGGNVYAIHHNGVTVPGFPIEIGQMWTGPAVHDIDSDGDYDIVSTTYDGEVYVIEVNGGAIRSGYPFDFGSRISVSPTIVDINNDGIYEIAAGSNDGQIYLLDLEGSIYAEYNTGDDIRGGISICDLNNDGQLDLIFGGYDDKIHVWDPVANELLPGWPVDLGFNILSEPLVADLDGDGQVEVLAARKTGMIFAYESDGSVMNNFPIPVDGSIESTPVIEDIDNDGDLEVVIGSSSGLEVIDIKFRAELMDSWSVYRGTNQRTGVYDATVMSVGKKKNIVPDKFYVSSNYPNPFNPITRFYIDVPEAGNLSVKIYDVNGKLVKELINTYVNRGRVQSRWSGKNEFDMMSPTGIYFLKVETSNNYHVQKLALVK